MCSNYRQRFVISERKKYLKKVKWINRLGVHFWSGEGKFSDCFLEIKLDIKWITILDENYYLLKAIQDQGCFLPPFFKTKIKENAAILTIKENTLYLFGN
jgi:hypothetical protein